eukprot:SAG31_NODE_40959_length_278_cov_0.860335_1_plen_29_part_01
MISLILLAMPVRIEENKRRAIQKREERMA